MSFWSFGLIFFFCYFGQSMTTQFEGLCNQIYQCDWYLFPTEAQQMLPIIMIVFQKSVALRGFGNVYYTRESFKNVKLKIQ